MRSMSRYELKYRLTCPQYLALRNALRPLMKPDPFTAAAPGGRYLVRSLYYDSHDYKAYFEREDGQFGRIKLRIRSYVDCPEDNTRLSVELKTKKGKFMDKYGVFTDMSQYRHFLQTGHWDAPLDPVLMEFERLLHVRSLLPCIIVQYRREGFSPRSGEPFRLTMDHDICSARSDHLFPEHLLLHPHRPKSIILEIKYKEREPDWLLRLARQHDLKIVSNSKYVQGIEAVRPDMVTPRVEIP